MAIPFPATQVSFRLLVGGTTNELRWSLAGAANGVFLFQTGTNLANWTTLATLTNSGAPFSYQFQALTNENRRFFRTVQEN